MLKTNKQLIRAIVILSVIAAAVLASSMWREKTVVLGSPIYPYSLVTFDPFMVNLADSNGTRFLRTTLSVVIENEANAKKLQKDEVAMRYMRSEILDILRQQTFEVMTARNATTVVVEEIIDGVNDHTPVPIHDVLITEFVIQ